MLLHCCESSRAHNISQPGNPAKGLSTLREFDFEGQWDLITELPQDWGNRLLEGRNKTLCTPGSRRKEQWPHKRQPNLPVSVQESLVEVWVNGNLLWGQRHWIQQSWHKSLWRRLPWSPLPLPQFGLRPNYREVTQPHPPTENWIKDLLSMALPIRTRPRFPTGSPS